MNPRKKGEDMIHGHGDLVKYWLEQTPLYNTIVRYGGFQKHVSNIPIRSAFSADRYVRCIDERTPNGIHAAGSGIFLVVLEGLEKGLKGDDAVNAGLDAAAKKFSEAGVAGITSHDECGAAALVYGMVSNDLTIKFANSDQFGRYFSKRLSEMLGVENGNLSVHPSGFHIARVAYYDGTGKFNPAVIGQLPTGFVVSRYYLGAEHSAREIEIAAKIATGDHGYGELINRKNPFMFVAVTKDEASLAKLKGELDSVASKFDGKVVVDGFIVSS